MHCPNCGYRIDRRNLPVVCPKCDEDMIRAKARRPLLVDLAHRGETVLQALTKLDAAVSECVWHGHPSLKVIHGHGSGASRIKPHVLAQTYESMRSGWARCWSRTAATRGAQVLRLK
jgi:hypothetical protein